MSLINLNLWRILTYENTYYWLQWFWKNLFSKCTFKKYNISHFDLDNIQWDNNAKEYGKKRTLDERKASLQEILYNNDEWIIEGVYYALYKKKIGNTKRKKRNFEIGL